VLKKDFDFLPVSNSSILTAQGTVNDEAACQAECTTAACVFYQFNKYGSTCATYDAPGGNIKLGMKMDEGVYAVSRTDTYGLAIGAEITDAKTGAVLGPYTVADYLECYQKCDKIEGCVVVLLDGTSCHLRQGDLSADYSTKYKVVGDAINYW
jgi:hypothetical protein